MNQGPAGIIAAALIYVFAAKEKQAKEFALELKELHRQHKADMDTLVGRFNITTNKLFDKVEVLMLKVAGRRPRKTGVVAVDADGNEV